MARTGHQWIFHENGIGVTANTGRKGDHRDWRVEVPMLLRSQVPWVAIMARGSLQVVRSPEGVKPWLYATGDTNGNFPDMPQGDYRYECVEDEMLEYCCGSVGEDGLRSYEPLEWTHIIGLVGPVTVQPGAIIILAIGKMRTALGLHEGPHLCAVKTGTTSVQFHEGARALIVSVKK
jgi:hypothetical protein